MATAGRSANTTAEVTAPTGGAGWKCQCDWKMPNDDFDKLDVFEIAYFRADAKIAAVKSFLTLEEFRAAKTPCTIDHALRHSKYPEDEDSRSGKSFVPMLILRRAKLLLINKDFVKHELVLAQLELVANNWQEFLPISEALVLFYLKTMCQLKLQLYADAKGSHSRAMRILAEIEEDWPTFEPDFIRQWSTKLSTLMQTIEENNGINVAKVEPSPKVVPVMDEVNHENPALAKSVCMKTGAGLFAEQDIPPGQIISIEEALTLVLIPNPTVCGVLEWCHWCLGDTFGLSLPCRTCPLVVFCSLECRDLAIQSFHKHDCSLGLTYMLRKDMLIGLLLRGVFSLNGEKLPSFLTNPNRQSGGNLYFPHKNINFGVLVADLIREAGIVMHDGTPELNLARGYCREWRAPIADPEGNYPGIALFSTLSLISHSCLANAWYFSAGGGKKTILFTTRAVKAGEEITIPYIRIYVSDVKMRQQIMQYHQGIKCECLACTKGWGHLEDRKGMKKVLSNFVLSDRKSKEENLLDPDKLLRLRVQESMHWHKKMSAELYAVWATHCRHEIVSAMALKYG